jgi:Flp pilus assembly protein TadG
MMLRIPQTLRPFAASTGGVAAIEFAAILPVMVVIFLATFDGGRAIATYMKVRAATYSLAEMTNEFTLPIASTDMSGILCATATVMAPYTANPSVTISQIQISNASVAKIEWSANQGGTARTVGTTVTPPSALVVPSTYLILAEVSNTYTPLFGFFGSGGITFSDYLYVTPRVLSCIVYTPQSSTC